MFWVLSNILVQTAHTERSLGTLYRVNAMANQLYGPHSVWHVRERNRRVDFLSSLVLSSLSGDTLLLILHACTIAGLLLIDAC
jgi:hypothetical protein